MDEEKNRQLDLGLSALLSSMSGENPAASTAERATPQSTPPPEGTVSEYPSLAQAGQWGKLIALTESHLGVAPDEVEPRVWWIRAHLGALSMPASFLAAPLDALVRRTIDRSLSERVRGVLKETCELTLERLRQIGDREHYDNLFASMLAAGFSTVRPEEPQRGRRAAGGNTATESSAEPRGKGRTSQSSVGDQPAQSSFSETRGDDLSHSVPQERVAPQRSSRAVMISGAVGLVALGALWFAYPSLRLMNIETVSSSEGFVLPTEERTQVIPALERRDPVGSLSALFYSIDQPPTVGGEAHNAGPINNVAASTQGGAAAGTISPASPAQPQAEPSGQTGQPSPPSVSQQDGGKVVPPAPGEAPRATGAKSGNERINTSSPVEGPEFRAGANRMRREPRDRPADPFGSDGRVGPRIPGGYPGGHPGGHTVPLPEYNPPYPPVTGDPPGSAAPRDPAAKDPLPAQGRRQVVLAATMVLSEPNYMGVEIAKLQPGDAIEVVGRVGRFLRIRSVRGATGYVLAQDVEPAEAR